MTDQRCKLCEEPYPPFALHFSNRAAIEAGYCSYFCMLSDLGKEKALKALQKYRGKSFENQSQDERS